MRIRLHVCKIVIYQHFLFVSTHCFINSLGHKVNLSVRWIVNFIVCFLSQNTYRGRGEIGGVHLSSHLERIYITISYVMVDIVKGDGRAPPTLTRLG